MTTYGDYEDDMKHMTDVEIDAVLDGQSPNEDTGALAQLIAAARAGSRVQIDASTEQAHLDALLAEVASPSEDTTMDARVIPFLRRRFVKVAIVAGAVVLSTGGLAAADVLPTPIEDAVSSVADFVGVDLDDDDAADDAEDTETDEGDDGKAHDEEKAAKKSHQKTGESEADEDNGYGNDFKVDGSEDDDPPGFERRQGENRRLPNGNVPGPDDDAAQPDHDNSGDDAPGRVQQDPGDAGNHGDGNNANTDNRPDRPDNENKPDKEDKAKSKGRNDR